MTMNAWSVGALALVGCLGAGCSNPTLLPPTDREQARGEWEARGWSDYSFDFQRECFCVPEAGQPVTITVRDEQVVEVRSRTTGELAPTGGSVPPWPTFVDILDEVERAEASGEPLSIEYGDDGLPRRIQIGRIEVDAGVVYHLGRFIARQSPG